MSQEKARDKLAVLTAFNILNGHFPKIIGSVSRSIERAEFTAEEFVGFIGEVASEVAGCERRRVPIELRRSGQEFPQVAEELNNAMEEKEFDWAHLLAFLHEVHRILNQLRASERASQQTEGERVMDKKEGHEKELKALSHEIMGAITENEKVMATLKDLKERGIVDSSTLLGLALRIGEITEVAGMTFQQEELGEQSASLDAASATSVNPNLPAAPAQSAYEMIDGRVLSPKEAVFQNWSADQFDERAWLKRVGLIF
jgi:hypothetical protein